MCRSLPVLLGKSNVPGLAETMTLPFDFRICATGSASAFGARKRATATAMSSQRITGYRIDGAPAGR